MKNETKDQREKRLAEALRANLRRRKDKTRESKDQAKITPRDPEPPR